MADTFTITVDDAQVHALLTKLQAGLGNMRTKMHDIGELLEDRTTARFTTSTDPLGNKWLPNAEVTYGILANKLGKSYLVKDDGVNDGRVNKKGANKLAAKKPLIGETKVLSSHFAIAANAHSVTFGTTSATKAYAAIQNFGGMAGKNRKVKIPARAFMPADQFGDFYPDEKVAVIELLESFIADLTA